MLDRLSSLGVGAGQAHVTVTANPPCPPGQAPIVGYGPGNYICVPGSCPAGQEMDKSGHCVPPPSSSGSNTGSNTGTGPTKAGLLGTSGSNGMALLLLGGIAVAAVTTLIALGAAVDPEAIHGNPDCGCGCGGAKTSRCRTRRIHARI
jgi:hypothetical protein